MATRRCLAALPLHLRSILLSSRPHKTPIPPFPSYFSLSSPTPTRSSTSLFSPLRHFSSSLPPTDGSDGEEDDEDGEENGGWDEHDNMGSRRIVQSGKSEEEKRKEAEEIGYKVVGPLDPSSENPFKLYEPAFAVVQIGSHQFKVSNGDSIFTEKLKYCDVNDKLVLKKVLMLGTKSETIIGRPVLVDASVHAVVEEHALDAKVIIFKKKRRKNYRRTKGHRQELTKLRITDIQGIAKSEALAAAA
ncbi:50S ribosomal protein L21 [Rhynchospora pubera]|uniref:Large ribosomal subunit protein bL21m n=1 Tax=Rhynchospora pubera TaxID=906938 RepID=A0AAV8GT60_9POAL|nr:50S ribosomal protein L21 [Rhynchospora pubera]